MDIIKNIYGILIDLIEKLMRLANHYEKSGNFKMADLCYDISSPFLGIAYYIAYRWA